MNKKNKLQLFYNWLTSNYPEESLEHNPKEKLLYNMKITAKNRYHASTRLRWEMKISFFTTTFISLGLIFIPLMQNSEIELSFKPSVLNMIQIFLAVSVLIYSVVNGLAKYESRIQALRECGDNIRDLIREYRGIDESEDTSEKLKEYTSRYNIIVTKPENHLSIDYLKTKFELNEIFKITGLRRLFLYIKFYSISFIPFLIPLLLITFELTFISDMLGITDLYSDVFKEKIMLNTV